MAREARDALFRLGLASQSISGKTKEWFNRTFATEEGMKVSAHLVNELNLRLTKKLRRLIRKRFGIFCTRLPSVPIHTLKCFSEITREHAKIGVHSLSVVIIPH